jgi:hypothetical protein
VCAPIADKAARERCGAAAALASAERTGDPGHCDSLEGTERERCLSSTVSRRAARDGDPAPCYGLAEPGARDQCKLRALDTIGRVVSARLAGQLADIEDLLASEGDTAAGEREASHPPEVAARRQWSETAAQGGHRVERTALSARRGGDAVRFTRLEGRDLGIDLGTQTVMVDYVEPLSHGRGIAAGDVDGDGWTDLAFATRRGVRLYRGLGPRGFAPVRVAQAGIRDKDVLLVALVDVDGDGSRDIFATTVGQGYYFLRNVRGSFEDQHLGFIWDPDVLLARAATFGDVDRNGRLDLVVGGWAPGREASLKLYRNGDEGFRPEALPSGGAAYAMTALLSDVTDDGSLDLLVGNDFEAPDWLLLGRESGGLEAVAVDSGTLPFTPIHTMSYDTGDVDNDGHSDIFATDLAFAGEVRDGDCGLIRHDEDRRRCEHNQRMERAIRQNDVRRCVEPGDGLSRNTCLAGALLYIATTSRLPALCDRMPRSEPGLRLLCEELAVSPLRSPEQNARLSLPRGVGFPQHQANVLLLGQGGERFAERGAALGVAKTSWSWSGKLADLDLDGWLDLYVVNGVGGFSVPEGAAYPSYFFKNRGDGSFTHDREAGLDDPLHGSAFVYVDFDGDGDLDIVVTGFNAPPRVFRNDTKTGGAILVELRDQRGNAFGVGSRITLHFEDGSSQYRELKLGGGYLSFDPTVAHFGVGARTRAVALTVRWSTGEAERIEGPFEAGFQYRVTRLR